MFEQLLSLAIWLAGVAHFCIIPAGLMAPKVLSWGEDVRKLQPFTRKAFWVYYYFTGLTIILFGGVTFALHDPLLNGDFSALVIGGVIALWWSCRILVDCFYFSHREWPQGKHFLLGHIVLTTTFFLIVGTFVTVIIYHAIR